MTRPTFFSCGLELAASVASSGVLQRSWNVISSLYEGINSNVGLSWMVLKESNLTIIAFVTTPICNYLQADLVSSSVLREKNLLNFEFLSTERNPTFSVDQTAVSLFYENLKKLDELKSEINSSAPLIVTGHALGGSVASLFTLSLLDSMGSGKNRPLCITFGSPLIGDKYLQQAISLSSTWNSCFLNVISHKDPLPSLFFTNHGSSAGAWSPQNSAYMPFGTFLLCSDITSTCFENPDSILELLVAMGSNHVQNQGFQSADYGNVVENLHSKAICKDYLTLAENLTRSDSLLASISLQLYGLGLTPLMQHQQQNIDISILEKMTKLEDQFISQKRTVFDPSKKLNMVKKNMANLEWYKKDSKIRDIGYFDSYKEKRLRCDQDVVMDHKKLRLYWEKMVEEAEMKPQKEGAAFRKRWLFGGTNYRRMVEPLVIAQYYKEGGEDYVTKGRPKHFKQLEEWLKDEKTGAPNGLNSASNVQSILTMDSCFWANVEEALLSCKQFKDVQSSVSEKEEARKKLLEFEKYAYGLIKNYEVSLEIFLKKSSYMTWWNKYKDIIGTSYNSALASFMSNADNYNVMYAEGTYNFP